MWLALAGCSYHAGGVTTGSAAGSDATTDTPIVVDAPTIDAVPDAPPDAYACTTAGLACPNGAAVKLTCNGACWVKCTAAVAFPDEPTVAAACVAWGGKLAPLRTAADQGCVSQMVFPSQASWIGFEQAPGQITPALGWSWNSDGVPLTYTHWSSGQPDDGSATHTETGREQCAYMTTLGEWQDTPCTGNVFYRFSCVHD